MRHLFVPAGLLGLAVGLLGGELLHPSPALAGPTSDQLPPLFQSGAVVQFNNAQWQIEDVQGLWIKVVDRWMYVPNMDGSWSAPVPPATPPDEKPK